MAATLKACGPAILVAKDGILQEIVSVVSLIITRSHPCQQDLGDEEEELDLEEGSSEYDWLVIDTALDVVVGLAAALGPAFSELWKIFEKPVLKLASSTEDLHRSTSVGTIAEVIKYSESAISDHTESLGTALARRLSDHDLLAKSNAAYAIGLLILHSNDTAKTYPLYPKLWEKLEPLLSVTEMRMTDNVAGAVSRMMLKNPDSGFVSEALPAVVNVLPLKEDYEENSPIYQNIFQLCKFHNHLQEVRESSEVNTFLDEQSNPTVQQFTPQLLSIFEKVLGGPDDQLEPDTRQIVQRMVQGLQG